MWVWVVINHDSIGWIHEFCSMYIIGQRYATPYSFYEISLGRKCYSDYLGHTVMETHTLRERCGKRFNIHCFVMSNELNKRGCDLYSVKS